MYQWQLPAVMSALPSSHASNHTLGVKSGERLAYRWQPLLNKLSVIPWLSEPVAVLDMALVLAVLPHPRPLINHTCLSWPTVAPSGTSTRSRPSLDLSLRIMMANDC